jgi:hypothetical protein
MKLGKTQQVDNTVNCVFWNLFLAFFGFFTPDSFL